MDVEYLLHGSLSVCEEEVDSLAPKPTSPQRGRYSLRHAKELRASLLREICQRGGRLIGDDKDVAGVDWLDVHERRDQVVAVDERGRGISPEDLVENSFSHVIAGPEEV